jgi:hypothetical protein
MIGCSNLLDLCNAVCAETFLSVSLTAFGDGKWSPWTAVVPFALPQAGTGILIRDGGWCDKFIRH